MCKRVSRADPASPIGRGCMGNLFGTPKGTIRPFRGIRGLPHFDTTQMGVSTRGH